MHQLLELIKKEQNIYNVVFHELIRQVNVVIFCLFLLLGMADSSIQLCMEIKCFALSNFYSSRATFLT